MFSVNPYSGSTFSLERYGGDVFPQTVQQVDVFTETARGRVFTQTVQWVAICSLKRYGSDSPKRNNASMFSLKRYGGDVFTQTVQWVDVFIGTARGGVFTQTVCLH